MSIPGYKAGEDGLVYVPRSPQIVAPWVPEVRGYALDPGSPCPCLSVGIQPSTIGRNFQVEYQRCEGIKSRETVTTYTKDEWDGVSDEDSWNDAWPSMVHTEKWESTGTNNQAIFKVWNLGHPDERTETTPCPLLEKTEDEWDPGPPADNPGAATYTVEIADDITYFPDGVDVPGAGDPFEGEFAVGDAGSVTSKSEAEDFARAYKTEWRWVIDLTEWPGSSPWPPGFVFQGTVVWWEGSKEFDNDDPGVDFAGNPWGVVWDSLNIQTEEFFIDEENRRWEGTLHTSLPDTSIDGGRTRVKQILSPRLPYLFLPFP